MSLAFKTISILWLSLYTNWFKNDAKLFKGSRWETRASHLNDQYEYDDQGRGAQRRHQVWERQGHLPRLSQGAADAKAQKSLQIQAARGRQQDVAPSSKTASTSRGSALKQKESKQAWRRRWAGRIGGWGGGGLGWRDARNGGWVHGDGVGRHVWWEDRGRGQARGRAVYGTEPTQACIEQKVEQPDSCVTRLINYADLGW